MTECRSIYKIGLTLAALAASVLIAPAAGAQTNYPWCAQYGSDNDGTNCGFSTLEQCRWALSGNGGFCVRNPFYEDAAKQERLARKRTRN